MLLFQSNSNIFTLLWSFKLFKNIFYCQSSTSRLFHSCSPANNKTNSIKNNLQIKQSSTNKKTIKNIRPKNYERQPNVETVQLHTPRCGQALQRTSQQTFKTLITLIFVVKYESRSINKLQNSIILLAFQISKIWDRGFVGNFICNMHDFDCSQKTVCMCIIFSTSILLNSW